MLGEALYQVGVKAFIFIFFLLATVFELDHMGESLHFSGPSLMTERARSRSLASTAK